MYVAILQSLTSSPCFRVGRMCAPSVNAIFGVKAPRELTFSETPEFPCQLIENSREQLLVRKAVTLPEFW